MGLDGGTKISRADVLRGASWRLANADTSRSTRGGSISTSALIQGEKVERHALRKAGLSSCYLTGDVLQPPLVADYLGHVYNKANVMEFLLARAHDTFADDEALHRHANILRTNGERLHHLKRLRDVFDIRLLPENFAEKLQTVREPVDRPQARASRTRASDGHGDLVNAVCPVTQQPFVTGPCAVIVPCGHCVSCRAIKLAQSGTGTSSHCSVCDTAFDVELDVVELVPLPDVEAKLLQSLKKRKSTRALKVGSSKQQKREALIDQTLDNGSLKIAPGNDPPEHM